MGYYNFNPTRGFENLIQQIQNVSNEFSKGVNIESATFKPRIDITESTNNFSIYVELPGIAKEKINISVSDERVLNIKGEKISDLPESRSSLRNERKFGEFSRSLQLPDEADVEKINATFLNGVLELSIPKKEPDTPKVIEVKLS